MTLLIHSFPCLIDNFGFILLDVDTGLVGCVDTPDPGAIQAQLSLFGHRLDLILNTHWHSDHAGGNAELRAATGARLIGPEEVARLDHVDEIVSGGETIRLGATEFRVIPCGGHTLGHVAYYAPLDQVVFVGDALFAMGCGRIFEGTPAQMWESLQRLSALPDSTRVYFAHEYTEQNARFALSLQEHEDTRKRADEVARQREGGRMTVPTTILEEKRTNPFLRAPTIVKSMGLPTMDDHEAFALLRSRKDIFGG
jgi:hydroxyacylglutathione hydrolase